MEGKDFADSVKDLEMAYLMLRESIKDLTNCADSMEKYLNIIKNPITLIMDNNLKEKLDKLNAEMQAYMFLASNKLEAYSNYVDKMKGE